MAKAADAYDAVIIGAGLGGLVCGCYLAKAGMKVLIAEQHFKPGGYCSSFTRGGFTFDAAAHSFGGYREGGIVNKIIHELDMADRLCIKRNDPSEVIITPHFRVSYRSDMQRTIEEFKNAFPSEHANIESFFRIMRSGSPQLFVKMRKLTFLDFLNSCFKNEKIKTVLAIPLFTYSGLTSSQISFCAGATIFSEFLMDGGYYPAGAMQRLPDVFADRFREYGGDLRLSCRIKKIRLRNGRAVGIITEEEEFIPAGWVISNADARQTFFSLVGHRNISGDFRKKINTMTPSQSYFVVYMGLDSKFRSDMLPGSTVNYFPHYDLEKAYTGGERGEITSETGYILRMSCDASTLTAVVAAPFRNKKFWHQHKSVFRDKLVSHLEITSVPGLKNHMQFCEAASPYTMYRYTGNFHGAAYGWASIPSQFADIELKKPPVAQNLFLAGHWTTQGIGIPGVVYSGFATAHLIQRMRLRKVL